MELTVTLGNNLTEMKRYFHISLLGILPLLIASCSSTPSPAVQDRPRKPIEMYVWSPPEDFELDSRKKRQADLDSISREMDILHLKQNGLDQQTYNFNSNLKQSLLKTEAMENELHTRILFHQKQQMQLKRSLDELNLSHNFLKTRLHTLEAMRAPSSKKFSKRDYTAAIQYLKDGKLKQSMHKFNVALHSNPPVILKDNIHFGLASVYYKLRKYSKAIKHLEAIRKNFPKGDKWYMSHVMLGIIHNTKGEKSRALYILNQALEKNPPESIKRTIDLMMNKIQEEEGNVTS
ncbi:MAG: hypothetical protein NPINA01_12190 [Nitrospinaceae bacterium]|nr:MAG: hypothetical protein NPINA01_12190 [Nitrospinaceae bacterium]